MQRNFFLLSVIMIFTIFSCTKNSNTDSNILKIKTNWNIISSAKTDAKGAEISSADFSTADWYAVNVPTTVLAALVKNKVYNNPYYGLNLKSIPGYREGRWLAMKKNSPFYPVWWYRSEFVIPQSFKGKKLVLHLDGINYKANIWLNGQQVADSSKIIGMFRRFEFNIDKYAKCGEKNVLAVEISAPGKLADIEYHTKQLEATTGWDDHNPQPPDLNMGIWREVYITASNEVVLKNPYIVTDLDLPKLDKAFLTISIDLQNKTNQAVNGIIKGTIEDIKISKRFHIEGNEIKTIKFTPQEFKQLIVENPRLWWPHPVGKQNLYSLKLSVSVNDIVSDSKQVRFGIREVSTYINDEGWRGYKVNGKNILIRGGAWMTSDMMLNLTHNRYDALIRYAREANLNALRSEGFSIRETEEFYNLCDEYGILVIQQLFGRNLPDEALAVSIIKDMILRIRNHPSLIHFLGHDETFPTENLDKSYRDLIAKYTPQRTYQPHSGAFEIENRYKTGGTRTGTMELWTYATPAHYYTHKEDGAWGFAQSGGIGGIFAPYESVRRMIPKKDLWPVKNETFSFHTVLQGIEYFDLVLESLNKRYGKANNIKEFLRKGQALNYESARGMFEAYARNKYDALGITTWKYDAAWPAALTWQYVDWYLNVGGAYYGAKKACEPLHVQYSYDDNSIYVVNGFYKKYDNLKVSAKLFNSNLNDVYSRDAVVSVSADGKTEAFKLELPERLSKLYFLSLKLFNDKMEKISDNFYWLSTVPDIQGSKNEMSTKKGWWVLKAKPKSFADFKDLNKLPKVKLDMSYTLEKGEKENIVSVKLTNNDSYLAFQVHLALINKKNGDEILPTYWEDNYITLLPGENRDIKARFSGRLLNNSDVNVKIEGWNIEN